MRSIAKRQIFSIEKAHIGSVLPLAVGISPPDICSGYGRIQWGKSGSTHGTVGCNAHKPHVSVCVRAGVD